MMVAMQTERLETLEQVGGFVEGNAGVDFELTARESACGFVRRALVQFGYHGLGKADKGTVRGYVGKVTGLSRAQVTRLIRQLRWSWFVGQDGDEIDFVDDVALAGTASASSSSSLIT